MSLLADGLKNRPPTAKGETHNFIHLDMEFRTNTHKQSSHACSVEQRVLLLTDGLIDRTLTAKEKTHIFIHIDMEFRTNTRKQTVFTCLQRGAACVAADRWPYRSYPYSKGENTHFHSRRLGFPYKHTQRNCLHMLAAWSSVCCY